MPTYQYACTACGHRLEAVQAFADEPLTDCPLCGGRLRKVFSAVGVVFKGSGFYRTDSRSSSAGEQSTADKTTKVDKPSDRSGKPSDKPSEGAAKPSGDDRGTSSSAAVSGSPSTAGSAA